MWYNMTLEMAVVLSQRPAVPDRENRNFLCDNIDKEETVFNVDWSHCSRYLSFFIRSVSMVWMHLYMNPIQETNKVGILHYQKERNIRNAFNVWPTSQWSVLLAASWMVMSNGPLRYMSFTFKIRWVKYFWKGITFLWQGDCLFSVLFSCWRS